MPRPLLALYAAFGIFAAALVAGAALLPDVMAADGLIPAITKEMRCAVCGMHPAAYPKWMAQAVFKDRTSAVFDSPAELFRYLQDFPRYGKGRTEADIGTLYVSDYAKGGWLDARKAFFVSGSKATGPMGSADLPPFATKEAAAAFARANGGKVMYFGEVTTAVVRGLDAEDEAHQH